jgi:hypothetical protein
MNHSQEAMVDGGGVKKSILMLVLAVVLAGPHIPEPSCWIAAARCFVASLGFMGKGE